MTETVTPQVPVVETVGQPGPAADPERELPNRAPAPDPETAAPDSQTAAPHAASDTAPPEHPAHSPEIGLPAALESLLIIAAEPMAEDELASATGSPPEEVRETLQGLADDYRRVGRGFELRRVANGWRFYSSAHCAPVVHRWVTDGRQARLSQAALETLAVIAYRQPVSRAKVGSIRGVNVDAVMRTLQSRGLIEQTAEDPLTGAGLYATTTLFLERMNLTDLSELPPIVDLLPDPVDVADHVDGAALDLP